MIEKIYLVFDKDTKIYKGNEFSKSSFERKFKKDKENNKIDLKNRNYKNCDYIEMNIEEWQEFLSTNPEIIKIEDTYIEKKEGKKIKKGKLKSYKKERSLEELKNNALNKRKSFLKQTFEKWSIYGDIENMPLETKDKRDKAKREVKEIELITNKEDLKDYE